MKKLVLSTFLTIFFASANAQLSIAPEAGLNFANMRVGRETNLLKGGVIHTTMRAGIAVGVIADCRIIRNFSLQPGVFYLTNGCKVTGAGYVSVNTIQIPLNIQYGKRTGGGPDFFAGLGPFLSINFGYKEKMGGDPIMSYPVGNDTGSAIRSTDVGMGINAGVRFSKLYFRVRGQMGVTNLEPHGDEHNFARSSSLGITAGYYIYRSGKKAKK